MTTATVKDEVRGIVERLADNASWADLEREIAVRRSIEDGLRDSEQDRVMEVDAVRKRLGLRK